MVFSPVCCRTLFVARRKEESCMPERDELKVRPKVSSLCGAALFIFPFFLLFLFQRPLSHFQYRTFDALRLLEPQLCFVLYRAARSRWQSVAVHRSRRSGRRRRTTVDDDAIELPRHFNTAKREEAERVKEILVFRSRRLHHAAHKRLQKGPIAFWCVLPLKKKR